MAFGRSFHGECIAPYVYGVSKMTENVHLPSGMHRNGRKTCISRRGCNKMGEKCAFPIGDAAKRTKKAHLPSGMQQNGRKKRIPSRGCNKTGKKSASPVGDAIRNGRKKVHPSSGMQQKCSIAPHFMPNVQVWSIE